MKKIILVFILVMLLACSSSEKDLQGLWQQTPNGDWWLQINNDNTFDHGWKSNINASGEYDLDDNILNLRTEDEYFKSRKYKYEIKNDSLFLYKISGEIELVYIKTSNTE